jgi:hypothetical protein
VGCGPLATVACPSRFLQAATEFSQISNGTDTRNGRVIAKAMIETIVFFLRLLNAMLIPPPCRAVRRCAALIALLVAMPLRCDRFTIGVASVNRTAVPALKVPVAFFLGRHDRHLDSTVSVLTYAHDLRAAE